MHPWVVRLSLAVNFAGVLLLLFTWAGGTRKVVSDYIMNPRRARMVSVFESYPLAAGDIVFLGDSITEGGNWAEMFPGLPVKNRGIGGDTTVHVLERLDQITGRGIATVFLMIGTNDLGRGHPQEEIVARYAEILDRLRDESPDTRVVVQGLMPRAAEFAPAVAALNAEIRRLAEQRSLEYIDLAPAFRDGDDSMRDNLSNDELHLTGAGYEMWRTILAPYLEPR
jgi:lysophospholipase L1-like esterase